MAAVAALRQLLVARAHRADLYAPCDHDERIRERRESLERLRRLHGADSDHPDVAVALRHLAAALVAQLITGEMAQGALDDSARLLREALSMLRRLHGADADGYDMVRVWCKVPRCVSLCLSVSVSVSVSVCL
jgi:hypothetical protein